MNKIEVEAYHKYNGYVGVVSFSSEEIKQWQEDLYPNTLTLIKENEELPLLYEYGWDEKLGQYHSIRASKEFAEIWNSGVYNI